MSWILLALLGALAAAFVPLFAKMGLQGVDTTLATTIRAVIMAVFLVAVAGGLGKFSAEFPGGRALFFIILSGIAGALSWLAMFSALKTGPAAAVSALDRTSIVFVFLFSLLFLGTQFTWKSAVGAALIALGAMLMI